MKHKVLCFVALMFATVLIASAAAEVAKDEKKTDAVATDKSQDQARGGNFEGRKSYGCWCCGKKWCKCCPDDVSKLHETTGQYVLAGHGGGGWGGGGGGHGGGGGYGGGGGHGGGWGGGGRCPHCTAAEAHERARGGKP